MAVIVTPFLMFDGTVEAALTLYVAVVPDSRLVELERYGRDGPGQEGLVKLARASIGGFGVSWQSNLP